MLNSNNFKVVWWAILVIALGAYLYLRQDQLVDGKPTYFDVVVFLVWMAVCLAPIFKDVKLFGLELKQDIEQLKKDISHQLSLMKVELQSSIDVSSSNTSHVHINSGAPIPANDAEIPDIKQQIAETLRDFGFGVGKTDKSELHFANDIQKESIDLFKVRLSFERLINEYSRLNGIDPRRYPTHRVLRELQKNEKISHNIINGVLEVMAICNYAVHGEAVSENQIAFVLDSAPGLFAALKNELKSNA
ncbi:hypothetical protein [Shewanella xiamenensis]|jgi:hypothetical protein|uniref:hypothetical protein n=1 Tax=Shewanella xiamenensis TaxID=332186 RepID=UPI000C12BF9B|nr:hypothetical protein [Shewanella xiamenensis]PHY61938.1 hypothetical protein CS023_08405 [Shewanella xiamenensis]